jgi:hypothetical protein
MSCEKQSVGQDASALRHFTWDKIAEDMHARYLTLCKTSNVPTQTIRG